MKKDTMASEMQVPQTHRYQMIKLKPELSLLETLFIIWLTISCLRNSQARRSNLLQINANQKINKNSGRFLNLLSLTLKIEASKQISACLNSNNSWIMKYLLLLLSIQLIFIRIPCRLPPRSQTGLGPFHSLRCVATLLISCGARGRRTRRLHFFP